MDISLPFWTIPLAITLVGFAVIFFWPYARGGDYSFNPMPLVAFAAWLIGSLVAWLIYFIIF